MAIGEKGAEGTFQLFTGATAAAAVGVGRSFIASLRPTVTMASMREKKRGEKDKKYLPSRVAARG